MDVGALCWNQIWVDKSKTSLGGPAATGRCQAAPRGRPWRPPECPDVHAPLDGSDETRRSYQPPLSDESGVAAVTPSRHFGPKWRP